MPNGFYNFVLEELNSLKSADVFRSLPEIVAFEGKFIRLKERRLLNLSSNDYLGLAYDKSLLKEFTTLFLQDPLPLSSSSSRLISGNHPLYQALEQSLKDAYCRESALVFGSGYHANIGLLTALASKNCVIFSDRLNHASIIDGMLLSRAKFYRYKHCDYNHLEELLRLHRHEAGSAIIVTESVFSMDGDVAHLDALVALKQKYDCLLIVDEAHAVGVYGQRGLGVVEQMGLIKDVDVIVGTFGKALAGLGAYVICDEILRSYLINKARTFIFTTALAPVQLKWQCFVFEKVLKMQARRKRLLNLAKWFKDAVSNTGFSIKGDGHIIAIMLGGNELAVKEAKRWQSSGLFVTAIRPPTVPVGTARLRVSLRADISERLLNSYLLRLSRCTS